MWFIEILFIWWFVFIWPGLQERVLRCYELIQQMGLIGSRPFKSASGSVSSVPQSPIGVLDAAACLSYKSDEITVRPCTNAHTSPEPIPKRRKIGQTVWNGPRSHDHVAKMGFSIFTLVSSVGWMGVLVWLGNNQVQGFTCKTKPF